MRTTEFEQNEKALDNANERERARSEQRHVHELAKAEQAHAHNMAVNAARRDAECESETRAQTLMLQSIPLFASEGRALAGVLTEAGSTLFTLLGPERTHDWLKHRTEQTAGALVEIVASISRAVVAHKTNTVASGALRAELDAIHSDLDEALDKVGLVDEDEDEDEAGAGDEDEDGLCAAGTCKSCDRLRGENTQGKIELAVRDGVLSMNGKPVPSPDIQIRVLTGSLATPNLTIEVLEWETCKSSESEGRPAMTLVLQGGSLYTFEGYPTTIETLVAQMADCDLQVSFRIGIPASFVALDAEPTDD
jgi:hypothetical protein